MCRDLSLDLSLFVFPYIPILWGCLKEHLQDFMVNKSWFPVQKKLVNHSKPFHQNIFWDVSIPTWAGLGLVSQWRGTRWFWGGAKRPTGGGFDINPQSREVGHLEIWSKLSSIFIYDILESCFYFLWVRMEDTRIIVRLQKSQFEAQNLVLFEWWDWELASLYKGFHVRVQRCRTIKWTVYLLQETQNG